MYKCTPYARSSSHFSLSNLFAGSSPELMIQMQESPLVFSTLRSVLSHLHSSPGEITEPLVAAGAMEAGPDDREDESEFTFRQPYSSPVSADKIFLNGQIRPLYPFTFPATRDEGITEESHFSQKRSPAVLREPLRRLFSRDREWNSSWDPYSCSGSPSHEEDELNGIDPEMYCLWRPRAGAALEGKRTSNSKKKKKNSEESGTVSVSKRWKVKDLVYSHGGKRVSDEPLE